jgi:hypothetical protein
MILWLTIARCECRLADLADAQSFFSVTYGGHGTKGRCLASEADRPVQRIELDAGKTGWRDVLDWFGELPVTIVGFHPMGPDLPCGMPGSARRC